MFCKEIVLSHSIQSNWKFVYNIWTKIIYLDDFFNFL